MSTTTTINGLLNQLENQTEQHIQFAIQTLQNLNEQTLLRKSANGGWSIAQCLWHLNSYGDFYHPEIEKGLSTAVGSKALFKSSWIGSRFTQMMQPGKGKYKAFKTHVPPEELNVHEVVAIFIQQQEQLLKLLRKASDKDLNRVKVPISISRWIKLNLGDVFSFLITHNERHLQQAKRNIS